MPPLRDAVSFVHAKERRLSALEKGRTDPRLERLRSGEDNEAATAFELLERRATLGGTQSAVEHDDRDPRLLSARSWSAMRAMSGETTIVGRSRIIAGT